MAYYDPTNFSQHLLEGILSLLLIGVDTLNQFSTYLVVIDPPVNVVQGVTSESLPLPLFSDAAADEPISYS